MRRKAFTLIEILVILGILGILMALTLPVLARARESGRKTDCLSNLRQLGNAVALYAADYDDVYPYGLDPFTRAGPLSSLFDEPYLSIAARLPDLRDVLTPYVRRGTLFRCRSEHPFSHNLPATSYYDRYGSSYSYDAYPAMLGLSDAYYADPSRSYLMADLDFWHGGDSYRDGRLNELFADYHVKNVAWLDYLDTIQPPP